MYHEPDKYVERQRDALKEMLRELMADGKITAEEAQQIQQEIDNQSGDKKPADEQAVQTPSANDEMAIPENQQRSVNPRGKTLHEIMGITR
jgi:polyhydroxyalkanoate synthesis regulator phasin